MFAVGYMCLSGFAYQWRNWRDLQLAIALMPVPFLIMWFFIPESPRWLLAHDKVAKGKEVSETMARRNGNSISEDVWQRSAESGAKIAVSSLSSFAKSFTHFHIVCYRLCTTNTLRHVLRRIPYLPRVKCAFIQRQITRRSLLVGDRKYDAEYEVTQ